MEVDQQVAEFQRFYGALREQLGKSIIGQRDVIDQTLIALISGGHVLLEGVPGLGKTRLVKSVAQLLGVTFSRIQFTPDLMPADIIGTTMAVLAEGQGARAFKFEQGPIFGNIVLADEVNRATPKTQSALLEAMEERAVTVHGTRYPLPAPFFLMATQNPIEMEGTYALPEAQLDRFLFKVIIDQPTADDMRGIIDLPPSADAAARPMFKRETLMAAQQIVQRVPAANHVKDFAIRIYRSTHAGAAEATDLTKKYVTHGMSPRGVQSLILAGKVVALLQGRFNLSTADLRAVALPVMRHRLILNFDAEADGVKADDVVQHIVGQMPEMKQARA